MNLELMFYDSQETQHTKKNDLTLKVDLINANENVIHI